MNVEHEKIAQNLIGDGYIEFREYHGQLCAIASFIFTVAIVVGIDSAGYKYRYCYHTLADAMDAYDKWDGLGPPANFIKRKPDFIRPIFPRTSNERVDDGTVLSTFLQTCRRCGQYYFLETKSREYCDNCGEVSLDYWGDEDTGISGTF